MLLIFQAWDVASTFTDWGSVRAAVASVEGDAGGLSDEEVARIVAGILIGISLLIGIIQVIASIAVFRGSNRARLWILALSTFSVIVSMTNFFTGDSDVETNFYSLMTIALQVGVLLTLSSDSSRLFTRFSTEAARADRQDRAIED